MDRISHKADNRPQLELNDASSILTPSTRSAEVKRKTSETEISLSLTIDGTGRHQIECGIGFLEHMLAHLAVHGLFDIQLQAQGDLQVDAHHTVEDIAISLGQAFDRALGERAGIVRIGSAYVPMDESLAFAAVDFSGRPYAVIKVDWHTSQVGSLPTSLLNHFLESFAISARINLHAQVHYGRDDHHQAEALFKAMGRALDAATQYDPRRVGVIPSTKGSLSI